MSQGARLEVLGDRLVLRAAVTRVLGARRDSGRHHSSTVQLASPLPGASVGSERCSLGPDLCPRVGSLSGGEELWLNPSNAES